MFHAVKEVRNCESKWPPPIDELADGTMSAKHPKGRWRLLVPDPFSRRRYLRESAYPDAFVDEG